MLVLFRAIAGRAGRHGPESASFQPERLVIGSGIKALHWTGIHAQQCGARHKTSEGNIDLSRRPSFDVKRIGRIFNEVVDDLLEARQIFGIAAPNLSGPFDIMANIAGEIGCFTAKTTTCEASANWRWPQEIGTSFSFVASSVMT